MKPRQKEGETEKQEYPIVYSVKTKKSSKRKKNALDEAVALIERYQKGTATPVECEALDTWSPGTDKIAHEPVDERQSALCEAKVWHHLSVRFHLNETASSRRTFPLLRLKLSRYVAAALVLLIGCGAWMIYQHTAKLPGQASPGMADARHAWITDGRHQTALTLADGTVVQVNAGSRLEISEAVFNKERREVWLTGEAFFEVAKNPEKPFIIHTGKIQTIVRGTSFNVKAYDKFGENVVSVRDGRVEIAANGQAIGVLTANRQLKYNVTNKRVEITDANWRDAAGWTEGRLVLNEASADELCLRLWQHFGVELQFAPGILDDALFHSSYPPEVSLDNVMEDICIVYGLKYERKGNQLILLHM